MAKRKKTPEGAILSAVLDYLKARRFEHFRMNTGAFRMGKRMVRFGTPGMADVLAFVKVNEQPYPLWIECKAQDGKVSDDQCAFQVRVLADGHEYCVVRSVEELMGVLGRYGL